MGGEIRMGWALSEGKWGRRVGWGIVGDWGSNVSKLRSKSLFMICFNDLPYNFMVHFLIIFLLTALATAQTPFPPIWP